MTIPYHIIVGKTTQDVEKVILEVFKHVDQTFNNWNPDSEVSQIGKLTAHERMEISSDLSYLLHLAKRLHALSEGRFDPTVAPLCKEIKSGKLPSNTSGVGFDLIHLDGDMLWKEKDETQLDLCAIAKGHAIDLIVEALSDAMSLYVEWGGEIRTKGRHPSGRKWCVQIVGGKKVELANQAIATSGNYIQSWEIDGNFYTHIIDPRTKMPLLVTPHSITSTTVIASSCAVADAVATALMVFDSTENAKQWALNQDFFVLQEIRDSCMERK